MINAMDSPTQPPGQAVLVKLCYLGIGPRSASVASCQVDCVVFRCARHQGNLWEPRLNFQSRVIVSSSIDVLLMSVMAEFADNMQ